MDQIRFIETDLRIQHRHDDGSWGDMVEDGPHDNASEHDVERAWAARRIFSCTSCAESIVVEPAGPKDPGKPG